MNAIKISSYGNASVLKLTDSEPTPAPSKGQVLVKIHAAGVNFVDIYQRRGTYPVQLPYIPGLEASGVVEALGRERKGSASATGSLYRPPRELQRVHGGRRGPADQTAKGLSFEQGAAFRCRE